MRPGQRSHSTQWVDSAKQVCEDTVELSVQAILASTTMTSSGMLVCRNGQGSVEFGAEVMPSHGRGFTLVWRSAKPEGEGRRWISPHLLANGWH